jgi:peptidoglycan/xylan/chitin deacetylase (PgdA/CDA1 family)
MPKKQSKVIYQRKKKEKKYIIEQVNLFLFLLIVLLSGVIVWRFQNVVNRLSKSASEKVLVSQTSRNTVYAFSNLRVPIFMYHYVENIIDSSDTTRMSLNIPPDIFEQQIQTLQKAGYIFLTMAMVTNAVETGSDLPEKRIVLTFDDGYKDFYTDVFPLLKKYNVKAVAYIAPGLLDTPNYMSKHDVIEVAQSGLVEIASHTVNHRFLKDDQLSDAYYEIMESKNVLQDMIDGQVISFAYPYGAFDAQAIDLVKKAGYKNAVSTLPGVEITEQNMFYITRIRPGRRVAEELILYLKQSSFSAF